MTTACDRSLVARAVCASALRRRDNSRSGAAAGPPPGAPAGQPPGGRGGGRGGVQVMTLDAGAWPDGGQIPAKYTQAGDQVSPPFAWSNVPDGVASFVLIVHDLDAATGNGTDDILHWMLWNIPGGRAQPRRGRAAGRAAARRHAADQRQRPVLSRPGRAGGGAGASLRLRAVRARRDDRRAGRRRVARRRRARRSSPRWPATSAARRPTSACSSARQ